MAEVPLTDAAAALGVSVETIRRRVKRGQLAARHDGEGRVWITLPDTARQETGPCLATATPGDGHCQAEDQQGVLHAMLDATQRELETVKGEVAFLRDELRRRSDEITVWQERLREAHLLAAQRPALPAPHHEPPAPPATPGTAPPPDHPWWRRWLPW